MLLLPLLLLSLGQLELRWQDALAKDN